MGWDFSLKIFPIFRTVIFNTILPNPDARASIIYYIFQKRSGKKSQAYSFEMNSRWTKGREKIWGALEFNWNAFPTMGKERRGGRAIRSDGIEDSSSFMMDQSRSDDNGNNGRGTRRSATELIDRNWSIILFRDFNLIEPWGMFAQCILKVSI